MCYLGVGLFGASLPFGPRFLHHFQTMTLEHVGSVFVTSRKGLVVAM